MGRQRLDRRVYSRLFTTFQNSVFRLEILPQYMVDEEQDQFAAFVKGRPVPVPESGVLWEWKELVSKKTAAGKSMIRVHVLPELLTSYLRFEIEWGYPYMATAGEDIRLLLPETLRVLRELPKEDFWLFDDRIVVFLKYNNEGRFLGAELDQNELTVKECCTLRDVMLIHAVPLRKYLTTIRSAR